MSFQQGLSGLNASARTLDVIGNNIANATTVGFKGSQTLFADVYANSLGGAGGNAVGIGVAVAGVQAEFSQGNITTSSNPLDLAINGNGFFRLDNNGAITYSRNGQFHLDRDGFIVNPAGVKITGYGVDATGAVVASSPAPLQLSTADVSPSPTSKSNIVLNLDSRATVPATIPFDPLDATTYNNATSMMVYDSLGNSHTLTSYFVKTSPNTWDVNMTADGVSVGAASSLTFASDGSIDTTLTTLPFTVSITPITTGAVDPLALTLDFKGTTQYGSTFGVTSLKQDGYTSGRLTGYGVSADGSVVGRYSNGLTRTLGQVVLAGFASTNGLQPLGGNNWVETSASGQPTLGAPGTGSAGVLQSGAVEESNVDLTNELVNMITAQRVYQANAQTIKTQDQVLQTLVNLR